MPPSQIDNEIYQQKESNEPHVKTEQPYAGDQCEGKQDKTDEFVFPS